MPDENPYVDEERAVAEVGNKTNDIFPLDASKLKTHFMTKAFLPHLLQRPQAQIVNLSSMGGLLPVPGETIYYAAKAAVKLMSETLSSELLGTNVRVIVVFPGAVAANIRGNSGVQAPINAKEAEPLTLFLPSSVDLASSGSSPG